MTFSSCLLALGLAALVAGRPQKPGPRSEILSSPPPPATTDAVAHTCPLVLPQDRLSCVTAPGYALPDLSAVPPPSLSLTIAGTSVGLLQVLPYNEMTQLLGLVNPQLQAMHQCAVPTLRTAWVLRQGSAVVRANRGPEGHALHACFGACRAAGIPFGAHVFGAIPNLGAVSDKALEALPGLRALRSVLAASAATLSVCMAANPCPGQAIRYLGLTGMQQQVNLTVALATGSLSMTLLPQAVFLAPPSAAGSTPPQWRRRAPPAFWHLAAPGVTGAVGFLRPLPGMASPKGASYVAGSLRGGSGINLLRSPSALLDLGAQASAWALLRDGPSSAVSLGLSAMPDVVLWNQLSLPLRRLPTPGNSRSADLLLSGGTDELWLRAASLALPSALLANLVAPVGDALALLFILPRLSVGYNVSEVSLHVAEFGGAALRLRLRPVARGARMQLSPPAQRILDRTELDGEMSLILHAPVHTSQFSTFTLHSAAQRWAVTTRRCSQDSDCVGLWFGGKAPNCTPYRICSHDH